MQRYIFSIRYQSDLTIINIYLSLFILGLKKVQTGLLFLLAIPQGSFQLFHVVSEDHVLIYLVDILEAHPVLPGDIR